MCDDDDDDAIVTKITVMTIAMTMTIVTFLFLLQQHLIRVHVPKLNKFNYRKFYLFVYGGLLRFLKALSA